MGRLYLKPYQQYLHGFNQPKSFISSMHIADCYLQAPSGGKEEIIIYSECSVPAINKEISVAPPPSALCEPSLRHSGVRHV